MAQITDTLPSAYVRGKPVESAPPPILTSGPLAWARQNLFSSWPNTLMTVLGLYFLWLVIPPLIDFLFIDAVWTGKDRDACLADKVGREVGACWPFITNRLGYYIYGQYPQEEWVGKAGITLFAAWAEAEGSEPL